MKYPYLIMIQHSLVLKCATKSLKIGLKIKIKRPKMFLNMDFCMENLLAREVTIFPEKKEKKKDLRFYLKLIKPTPNCKKSLPGVQTFEKKFTNLPESKVKDFWIISLAYAKSLFKKTFLDIKVLFVNRFSIFFCSIF